jgi:hypothetical protein
VTQDIHGLHTAREEYSIRLHQFTRITSQHGL